MQRNSRHTVLAALVLSALATVPAVQAQQCAGRGNRPMVCSIEVRDVTNSGQPRAIDLERGIGLRKGWAVDLDVVAYDQYGKVFPTERLAVRIDGEEDCRGRVDVDQSHRLIHLKGLERGSCTLTLWIPGNLNLEWPLRLEVDREHHEYGRGPGAQSVEEEVARRLYRAILDRDGEPASLARAADDIRRGGLERLVDQMLASDEFRRERANLSPSVLLQSFYRGLLDRDPDPQGVRTYWEDVRRQRYAEVLRTLLASREFAEVSGWDTGRGHRR